LVNENRRRHGMDRQIQAKQGTVTELASEARRQLLGAKEQEQDQVKGQAGGGRSETEDRLSAMRQTRSRGREG